MTNTHRLVIFSVFFALVNLSFIPLLSLYGLRVCPILTIPGFGFGCYYTAIYIATVNVVNLALLYIIKKNIFTKLQNILFKNRLTVFAAIYFIATAAALIVLHFSLSENHLSTRSRAPQILFFASVLLGLLQSYGLEWAEFTVTPEARKAESPLQRLWYNHIFRILFPIFIIAAILLHFILTQSVALTNGHTAPVSEHDSLINQISYVVIFLLTWVTMTLFFHFLSERKQVVKVNTHFKNLKDLNFEYSSDISNSWGLWTAILNQLNDFTKILGEKTRLVKSFSKFVTAGVVEQALTSEVKQVRGTNRELTVLMTDIRNFTSMSENLTPEQVVALLNDYFSVMLNEISKFHIIVDKFIGDAILAYVEHAPLGRAEQDNKMAVDAALAMLNALKTLNEKFQKQNLPAISIGIGIFRGPLVIGLIGSETKLQHTIIGDTVNRAARLEGLCKELGVSVVISDHVWNSLTPEKQRLFTSFGQIAVKGIRDPIEVFGGPAIKVPPNL